jgi:UDPglucose 6-dehydrogenase
MSTLKLGIVGCGFVGGAVSKGFNKGVEKFIVDPKIDNSISLEELVEASPSITFICLPTPQQDSHQDVDISVVRNMLKKLDALKYKGITVIKSTITPYYLTKFKKEFSLRMVYNPEFLRESHADYDFTNPSMQVLGGKWKECEIVEKAYVRHSSVKIVPTFKTDLITASFLKYTINSWLATKVAFFNELQQLFEESGSNSSWEHFIEMLEKDARIGNTHMQVPGPDGKFGFGGTCLPKDTNALLYYAKLTSKSSNPLSILKAAVDSNQSNRKKPVK